MAGRIGRREGRPLVREEDDVLARGNECVYIRKGIQDGELVGVTEHLVTSELALFCELVAPDEVEGIIKLVQRANRFVQRGLHELFVSPLQPPLLPIRHVDPVRKNHQHDGPDRRAQSHHKRYHPIVALRQRILSQGRPVTVHLGASAAVRGRDVVPTGFEARREFLGGEGSAALAGTGPELLVGVGSPPVAAVVFRDGILSALAVVLGGAVGADVEEELPQKHFHAELVLLLPRNAERQPRIRTGSREVEFLPQILVLLLRPRLVEERPRLGGEVAPAKGVEVRRSQVLRDHRCGFEVGHDHEVPDEIPVLLWRVLPDGNGRMLVRRVVVRRAVDPHPVPLVLLAVEVGTVDLPLLRHDLRRARFHPPVAPIVNLRAAHGSHAPWLPVRAVLPRGLPQHRTVLPLGRALGGARSGIGGAPSHGTLGEDQRHAPREPHVSAAPSVVPVVLVQLRPPPRLIVDGVHPQPPCEPRGIEECGILEHGHGVGVRGVEPEARVASQILELGGGDGH
mmetsp:Transcript_29529/g.71296  ORF Transcript_29529/g.71296 Transcript_29529/m.71296 type:complete len:511 (-) Transcript_29529:2343-3875(-)